MITNKDNLFFNLSENVPIHSPEDINQETIVFKKLTMDVLEEMHKYSTDERMYEYLSFDAFKDIGETKDYINKLLARINSHEENNRAMYWSLRRLSDNRLIGTAGILRISYLNGSAEWGFGIDPELWGKGYILNALESLKTYFFEVLELNRLYGLTFINNSRTIETMKAVGMKEEGILREFTFKDGNYVDGWKYSMLKKEYLKDKNNNVKSKKIKKNKVSNDEVIAAVSKILIEKSINIDSNMENVANWDSLNHMAIMVKINEISGIKLSPSEISKATSIKKIIELIEK